MAVTDKRSRGHPHLFTTYGETSPFAEAYRALRISLFPQGGASLWSLGVTGAGPRHGSSTTAANLGLIMGETGNRVILIDADFYRPTLHSLLGLPNAIGLSSVLQDQASVEQALQVTAEAPLLRLLAAGPPVSNPAVLLRQPALGRLFDRLRQKADVVIVDLPSVRAVAYTSLLASMLDGLVLVVRSGATSGEGVDRIMKRQLRGVNVVGIVLNKVPPKGSEVDSYRYYAQLTR
jgi:capsular exopolysaccharide synthesis family protein